MPIYLDSPLHSGNVGCGFGLGTGRGIGSGYGDSAGMGFGYGVRCMFIYTGREGYVCNEADGYGDGANGDVYE